MASGTLVLVVETSGLFQTISADLEDSITEIRVEQHLDDPTTFAIRFQEDFPDGQTQTAGHEQLARHREIAIIAPKLPGSDELICLVRGEIEQTDFDVATGGPGSWFEIRGQDLRSRGAREVATFELDGPSDQIMESISAIFGDGNVEMAAGAFEYLDNGEMYRFRGTPLEGVEALAQQSNLHFWISYEVLGVAPSWDVDFTINLLPSPPRNQDAKVDAKVPLDLLTLVPEKAPRLVILGDDNETVINFRVSSDYETVTSARAAALDRDGQPHEIEVKENPTSPTNDSGRIPIKGHVMTPAITGQPWYNIKAAEAAVTEGGWFITAQASTSVHMLGAVLQPHQLVQVVGAGCEAAGAYQVTDVTHVITPAEHWMELELRTNSLPKEPGNGKP